ncbi:MAG: hypothetical protein AAGK14_12020 [Verrucomicrobiota bacterium]
MDILSLPKTVFLTALLSLSSSIFAFGGEGPIELLQLLETKLQSRQAYTQAWEMTLKKEPSPEFAKQLRARIERMEKQLDQGDSDYENQLGRLKYEKGLLKEHEEGSTQVYDVKIDFLSPAKWKVSRIGRHLPSAMTDEAFIREDGMAVRNNMGMRTVTLSDNPAKLLKEMFPGKLDFFAGWLLQSGLKAEVVSQKGDMVTVKFTDIEGNSYLYLELDTTKMQLKSLRSTSTGDQLREEFNVTDDGYEMKFRRPDTGALRWTYTWKLKDEKPIVDPTSFQYDKSIKPDLNLRLEVDGVLKEGLNSNDFIE